MALWIWCSQCCGSSIHAIVDLVFTLLWIWYPCHCGSGGHTIVDLVFMPLWIWCSHHCGYGIHVLMNMVFTKSWIRCSCHCGSGVYATVDLVFMPLWIWCSGHCGSGVHATVYPVASLSCLLGPPVLSWFPALSLWLPTLWLCQILARAMTKTQNIIKLNFNDGVHILSVEFDVTIWLNGPDHHWSLWSNKWS